jgi:ketosteroid isomerase-like protein
VSTRAVADQLARVFAAFDAREVSTLAAFVTDDIRLRLGNAPMTQGRSAFVEAVDEFHRSVAGVHHEILHVYRDGDVAVVEFDVHYTRLDGRTVTLPCCNVFRIRDGLISEYRSYVDASPVYADVDGALPPSASR